jgi:hypothetical protein
MRLAEQNWQQYSKPKREEPQWRCRRSYRAKAALFLGGNAKIAQQPP